jgi:hypothetical protein
MGLKNWWIYVFVFIPFLAKGQGGNWQQHADYKMEVLVNVNNYTYKGNQTLTYTNNSPDTLHKVYYHLYFNAFQPGSEMDMRLRSIKDPDGRMVTKTVVNQVDVKESRIKGLKTNEIGFLRVTNLKQDGVLATCKEVETILEVRLPKPILPGGKGVFTLDFEGQVPVHIRRAGRNNKEGVALSMAQWFPKMAEYDFEGWHANAYIAREFYGVWGNFDVKITLDKAYTVAGTGVLQNPEEIGKGYQKPGSLLKPAKEKTLTWHFVAKNVHDFTWAADPDYVHDVVKGPNEVVLHFIYKNNPAIISNWKKLQPYTIRLMEIFNALVGSYPYPQYSVIQGGDGGMEYAMCTLVLGEGEFDGLLGLIAHEMAHSWFQQVLATNESKHGWMDEGFTSWLEDTALNMLAETPTENPYTGSYASYINLAKSGKEQPLTTHADRFDENRSYSISSYSKGNVFLAQLEYLLGRENLLKTLQKYYQDFKFKHPTPNDFKRTAEKISDAELDWYLIDFGQTTNTIDYGIVDLLDQGKNSALTIERIGRMPMPLDIEVEYTDGRKEWFYIPLKMMHFVKPHNNPKIKRSVCDDWAWGNSKYTLTIPTTKSAIKRVVIDPLLLMADVKRENNSYSP